MGESLAFPPGVAIIEPARDRRLLPQAYGSIEGSGKAILAPLTQSVECIMQPHLGDRTPWSLVCLLFCAGMVAAAQVGKAIVSLPLMRSEMIFGFDIAAVILSVFATLGAACGIGGGALVSWVGVRRSLLLGMI